MLHLSFLPIHGHQVESSTMSIWSDRSSVSGEVLMILRDYVCVTAVISMGQVLILGVSFVLH